MIQEKKILEAIRQLKGLTGHINIPGLPVDTVLFNAAEVLNEILKDLKPEKDNEKSILQEAHDLVYGERQEQYGSVTSNFSKVAALWSIVLNITITPEQVALCMVQLKIARQLYKPKRDNLVDAAGYLATIEKLHDEADADNIPF